MELLIVGFAFLVLWQVPDLLKGQIEIWMANTNGVLADIVLIAFLLVIGA